MSTLASYIPVIGEKRIVSIINKGGIGVAVPRNTVAPDPGKIDKGNRLIYLLLKVGIGVDPPVFNADDAMIDIKAKVPAGIIHNFIQRFVAADSEYLYTPAVRILPFVENASVPPLGGSIYDEQVSAKNIAADPVAQTVTVRILHLAGLGRKVLLPLLFGVEIDWMHSIRA